MENLNKKKSEKVSNFKLFKGNPFYKDGKLNKFAIGISCVSLAVALGISAYSVSTLHTMNMYQNEITYGQISPEDVESVVEKYYVESVSKYTDGEITYEQLQSTLGQMINEYTQASGLFTEGQINELNQIVTDYLASTEIYTSLDDNKKSISEISDLLYNRYADNYAYISSVEASLNDVINSNNSTDQVRYDELVRTDKNLKQWLDDSMQTTNEKINTNQQEITDSLNSSVTDLNNKIDENQVTMNQSLDNSVNDLTSKINDNQATLTQMLDEVAFAASEGNSDTNDLIKTLTGATDYVEGQSYSEGAYVIKDGMLYVVNESSLVQTDIKTVMDNLTNKMTSSFEDMQIYVDKRNEELEKEFTENLGKLNETLTQSIEEQANTLSQNIENTTETLTLSINDLDEKYANYYMYNKSFNIPSQTTLTGDVFKSYSNINVVYSSTDGFTANYELTDGALTITLERDASDTAPDSVNATIYIDNGSVNSVVNN